jgi:polyvinyl alcohol dehydrogenase (cytochrome)
MQTIRAGITALVAGLLLSSMSLASSWARSPTGESDGAALYQAYCAHCHEGQVKRAPQRDVMARLPASTVLNSLERGRMKFLGMMRTDQERQAISEWVTGKTLPPPTDTDETVAGFCADAPGTFAVEDGAPEWNGWGVDPFNTRFQPATAAGISAAQVPELQVKWVFGLPMDFRVSQPTVVGDRVFIGSMKGLVYALDAKTGCLHWSVKTVAGVRATPVVDNLPATNPPRHVVYVGDVEANLYALDAQTGRQLWRVRIDDHPLARITGTPKTHGNRIYASATALEEVAGGDPSYECCTFRGSMVALNRFNGKLVWRSYTIPDPPAPVRKNAVGVQLWGPSGASVWSSPALDPERNRIYVTTGDNYSDPASLTSDAVMAFDMRSGQVLWSKQFTAGDAWNVACETEDDTNCPEARGPDLDFASSPIVRILPDGRRVILAGQKSGVMHAIDPDRDGEILWQHRVGKGGLAGGIQWGSAADAKQVYVALSDIGLRTVENSDTGWATTLDGSVGGGMFAIDIESGERKWHVPPVGCGDRPQCSPAQSAAVSALPGVVFSGSVDGHLRGYATDTGNVVWDYNADQEYASTNGVKTKGGSFDGPGPTIVDGMLYVMSGYGLWGGMSGNALIAFSVNGE